MSQDDRDARHERQMNADAKPRSLPRDAEIAALDADVIRRFNEQTLDLFKASAVIHRSIRGVMGALPIQTLLETKGLTDNLMLALDAAFSAAFASTEYDSDDMEREADAYLVALEAILDRYPPTDNAMGGKDGYDAAQNWEARNPDMARALRVADDEARRAYAEGSTDVDDERLAAALDAAGVLRKPSSPNLKAN